MITINLLPDIKREYIRARRLEARVISLAVLSMVVAIGLVVVASIWTYGAQAVHTKLLTDSINKNMSELKSVKDINKYVTVQSQLANIDALHDNKTMYSRVFDILPKLNPVAPNSVLITSLSLDAETSTMLIEGVTGDFTGLETFRDTLSNAELSFRLDPDQPVTKTKFLKDVLITDQSLTQGADGNNAAVAFKITSTYTPEVFARTATNVGISIPQKETTQSKQDSPDVFGGDR